MARRAEHHLAMLAIEAIPEGVREFWYEELFSAYGNSDSRLEWLGLPPYKRTTGALNEVVDKLVFLRILSVPMFATFDISLENLVELSQRCRSEASHVWNRSISACTGSMGHCLQPTHRIG